MTSSPTGSSSIQNIQDDHQKKAAAIGDAGNQKQKLRSANLLQHVDHETPSPHTMEEERKHAVSFVLTFTNLTYRARVRREMLGCGCKSALPVTTMDISGKPAAKSACTKMLLNGICGKAREGEILAVMGASGSGKSTLIDALAKRISKESLQGSVKLNGEVIDGRLMRSISAYVRQEDLLFPMLTVEETLSFAAEFRLPRTVSREKKQARVQALIEQLGLRRAAKTIIGDEGHRGVSGGERRRVSIGIDIVHDPILLFLDEPTSGLDSTCAFMVVKVLQRIAQTGSIVILSIHQPSFRIVSLLDRMIFLSNGNTVYNGPSAHLPAYLADFGRPVPENENPTEFALDLIRELEVSRDGAKNLVDFYNSYKSTRLISSSSSRTDNKGLTLKDAINASVSRGKLVFGNGNDDRSSSEPMQEFANPLWKETAILTKRSVMNTRRLPELFFTRLGIIMVTGFILSTIFCRLDSSPKGVKERLGFLAFAISTTFYTCADALPVFLQERYIFMRETAYNAYRRSSYVISNAIVAAPPLVLLSLVFAAITFFAVSLAGGRDGFVYFFAITFASFWAGSGFVTFISGIISQVMVGYIVAIAAISYCLLFSGFFINRDRIPPYWIWFHYLSMVKYPYEGVLLNEFENAKQCFATGSQMFDVTPLKGLSEERKAGLVKALSNSLGINITLTTCVTTGSDILKEQSITQLSKWNCFWVTMAIGFFFRVLFYVALLIGSKNKRR